MMIKCRHDGLYIDLRVFHVVKCIFDVVVFFTNFIIETVTTVQQASSSKTSELELRSLRLPTVCTLFSLAAEPRCAKLAVRFSTDRLVFPT